MIYELGKEIRRLLVNGTTAAITTNIAPIVSTATSGTTRYPLITYRIVSSTSNPTKQQVSKFEEVRVQIDVYQTTPALVDALAYAVRNDLDKKTSSTYCVISEISFISQGPEFFFSDERVYMTSLDFNVIINE